MARNFLANNLILKEYNGWISHELKKEPSEEDGYIFKDLEPSYVFNDGSILDNQVTTPGGFEYFVID